MPLATPALLALLLIAQAPRPQLPLTQAPVDQPKITQPPKYKIDDTVSVVEPTFAGGTEQALLAWTTLMLQREPERAKAPTPAAKQAIVQQVRNAIQAKGLPLIALDPTDILRVLEVGEAPSDDPGLPRIMYRLQVIDSDESDLDDKIVFLFEFQLKKVEAGVASKRAEIYKEARSAMIEVKARGAAKSLSIRKSYVDRETPLALERIAKKYYLTPADLAKIIAEGQEKDGTAERRRRANNPAKMAARQQNALMLDILGAQLDAMASQVVARYNAEQNAKAAAFARSMQVGVVDSSSGGMGGGIKSVHVNGYYNSHGTYVNSYFRSPPSR